MSCPLSSYSTVILPPPNAIPPSKPRFLPFTNLSKLFFLFSVLPFINFKSKSSPHSFPTTSPFFFTCLNSFHLFFIHFFFYSFSASLVSTITLLVIVPSSSSFNFHPYSSDFFTLVVITVVHLLHTTRSTLHKQTPTLREHEHSTNTFVDAPAFSSQYFVCNRFIFIQSITSPSSPSLFFFHTCPPCPSCICINTSTYTHKPPAFTRLHSLIFLCFLHPTLNISHNTFPFSLPLAHPPHPYLALSVYHLHARNSHYSTLAPHTLRSLSLHFSPPSHPVFEPPFFYFTFLPPIPTSTLPTISLSAHSHKSLYFLAIFTHVSHLPPVRRRASQIKTPTTKHAPSQTRLTYVFLSSPSLLTPSHLQFMFYMTSHPSI